MVFPCQSNESNEVLPPKSNHIQPSILELRRPLYVGSDFQPPMDYNPPQRQSVEQPSGTGKNQFNKTHKKICINIIKTIILRYSEKRSYSCEIVMIVLDPSYRRNDYIL